MTISISVGLLADVEDEDADVVQEELDFLEEVNEVLREQGLPEHHEPAQLPEDYEFWTASVPEEALEQLVMVAATVAENASKDPVQAFPHLVGAQCTYYLPLDLPEPLVFELDEEEEDEFGEDAEEAEPREAMFGDEEDSEYLIAVGSSVRLQEELAEVAQALELPLERFAVDYGGEGETEGWDDLFDELRAANANCTECEQAARALVSLYHGCKVSQESKMVLCLG